MPNLRHATIDMDMRNDEALALAAAVEGQSVGQPSWRHAAPRIP